MIKFFILTLVLFSSCAMESKRSSNLSYDYVLQLQIGKYFESQIIKSLGEPSSRLNKAEYYSITYNDLETGNQRLTLNFSSASNQLLVFLWIPQMNESEVSIKKVKGDFKNSEFSEILSDNNPHAVTDTALLIDKKNGISISYNRENNYVEGISKFDTTKRFPAKEKISDKIPYSFGDELKSLKK